MPDDSTPRSRRALLAAAAGGAAALAAHAALPLTAIAADPNDVVLGIENHSTARTAILRDDDTAGAIGFTVNALGSESIGSESFGQGIGHPRRRLDGRRDLRVLALECGRGLHRRNRVHRRVRLVAG